MALQAMALSREASFSRTDAGYRTNSLDRCCCLPLFHRVRPEAAKRVAGDEMTLKVEGVVDGGMSGEGIVTSSK
jgi:hypothetical protein